MNNRQWSSVWPTLNWAPPASSIVLCGKQLGTGPPVRHGKS